MPASGSRLKLPQSAPDRPSGSPGTGKHTGAIRPVLLRAGSLGKSSEQLLGCTSDPPEHAGKRRFSPSPCPSPGKAPHSGCPPPTSLLTPFCRNVVSSRASQSPGGSQGVASAAWQGQGTGQTSQIPKLWLSLEHGSIPLQLPRPSSPAFPELGVLLQQSWAQEFCWVPLRPKIHPTAPPIHTETTTLWPPSCSQGFHPPVPSVTPPRGPRAGGHAQEGAGASMS